MPKRKSSRGGVRKGAGRPSKGGARENVYARIKAETFNALKAEARVRGISLSQLIAEKLERAEDFVDTVDWSKAQRAVFPNLKRSDAPDITAEEVNDSAIS